MSGAGASKSIAQTPEWQALKQHKENEIDKL